MGIFSLDSLKWERFNIDHPRLGFDSLEELNDHYPNDELASIPIYARFRDHIFVLAQRKKNLKWFGSIDTNGADVDQEEFQKSPTPYFWVPQFSDPIDRTKQYDTKLEALQALEELTYKKINIEEEEEEEEEVEEEVEEENIIEEEKTKDNFVNTIFKTPQNSAFTFGAFGFVGIISQVGFDIGYIIGSAGGGALIGLAIYYLIKFFKNND